jgi:putative ABC transport system substrate-binding protein
VTFYNPENPAAQRSMKVGRDVAQQLKIELVERQVHTVSELRAALQALRPGEADAIFYVADAMVTSQMDAVIETARAKKLPTMFQEVSAVNQGGLAAYGTSYREAGRLSAKQVQRVLQGATPGDLPVEQLSRPSLAINLKTAKALGLTIPRSLLLRADEVIQ